MSEGNSKTARVARFLGRSAAYIVFMLAWAALTNVWQTSRNVERGWFEYDGKIYIITRGEVKAPGT